MREHAVTSSTLTLESSSLQEVRPAAVRYHFQSLMAGTHTLEFQVVCATEGNFTIPPVKAFADNQAEVRLIATWYLLGL